MSRPKKIGLDYFNIDVDIRNNNKVSLIEAEYGVKGFGIMVALLCKIYADKGYYMEYDDDVKLLLAKSYGEDPEIIGNIIGTMARRKFFDNRILTEHGILTSIEIQERYINAASRREKVVILQEYSLIDVSVYNNSVIANINSVNSRSSTQSRVEKSRVYNTSLSTSVSNDVCLARVQTGHEPNRLLPPTKRITFNEKELSISGIQKEDIERWVKAYPAVDIQGEILRASEWLINNPIKHPKKSISKFLSNWFNKTQQSGGSISKTTGLLPELQEAIEFSSENMLPQFGNLNYEQTQVQIKKFIDHYKINGLGKTSWQSKLISWKILL